MKDRRVKYLEIVEDAELRRKERQATEAVRRLYPGCAPVRLFRTADGRIGCQLNITVSSGDRERLNRAYRAVMKVLGERRGRRAGAKTVQTQLHLPASVYSLLKRAAATSHATLSRVVTDALVANLGRP